MKKIICLLLAVLLCITGCDFKQEDPPGVLFYYLRDPDNFVYGAADGVVTSEERDPAGYRNNLKYLISLYLQGPVDENLQSPFPAGCKLVVIGQANDELTILLNSNFCTLKDMDLTLACVCLAKTCFSLTDVQRVRIMAESFSGQVSVDQTIHIDSLLLEDTPQSTE